MGSPRFNRRRDPYELCVMESTRGFDSLRAAGRAYLNTSLHLRPEAVVIETKTGKHVTSDAIVATRGTPPTAAEREAWAIEDKYDLLKEGA
jgi:hypothetical protein